MDKIKKILAVLDAYQKSHVVLAFPIAVIKRFGEESAGKQAALITYYGFLSVFPLILIFISILGSISLSNSEVQEQIIANVFQLFPALGNDLKNNVESLQATGFALLLQIAVLLYGARGLASIVQDTFNDMWKIETTARPNFIENYVRSFGMMLTLGAGMILGTILSFSLSSFINLGVAGTIFVTILNLVFTFGLFLALFRLGTSSHIRISQLLLGAILTTIGMFIVQRLGGYIMSEQLPGLEGSYGAFALALGLVFWIYLQAQILLYAVVATVVKAEKDWPKSII